jgi:hypothetical protein
MSSKQNPLLMKLRKEPDILMWGSWAISIGLISLWFLINIWQSADTEPRWSTFDTVLFTVAGVIAAAGTIAAFVMLARGERARRQTETSDN